MDATKKKERKPNPRATANLFSAFFFVWVWDIFKNGMKRELEVDDLFAPLDEHKSEYLGNKFERAWNKEISKQNPSLLCTLLRLYSLEFLYYGMYVTVMELVFRVGQPILLGQLIQYFEPDSNVSLQTAYLSALGIVICSAVFIFVRQPFMMAVFHLGMKLRVGVCSLIYRKALRLTHTALGETTVGQVVNLLSNDVSRFDVSLIHMHYLWIAPIQTLIVLYLMWIEIGISAPVGVLTILLFIPVEVFLGKRTAVLRLRTALKTDERVRQMNEIIQGIEVIKMYTWEIPFSKLVSLCRLNEIKEIRRMSYIRALIYSLPILTTRFTLFLAILAYALFGEDVTAQKVFVVTSYFNIIKLSMTDFFPRGITLLAETLVSIRRVQKFLHYDELQNIKNNNALPYDKMAKVSGSDLQNGAAPLKEQGKVLCSIVSKAVNEKLQPEVTVEMVTAKWVLHSDEETLKDVTMNVSQGELVSVIGPVGAGKSSLLHAILGELEPLSGTIQVNGRVSYASQEPWLFAGSVRSNILFGEPYIPERYHRVVKVCALLRDFELLPHRDNTIVGERGVSLSGGQRARINLARSIYKQADVYILDDPLSAVDAHVAKHLFEDCICKFLSGKTRILVTHQLQFLSDVDRVIVLINGVIEAEGSFAQLQESGLDFVKLLGVKEEEDDETSAPLLSHEHGDPVQRKSARKLRSQNSLSSNSSTSSVEVMMSSDFEVPQVSELRTRGRVQLRIFTSYFAAGGSCFFVGLMLFSNFVAQLLSSATDYWLSFWTGIESQRTLLWKEFMASSNISNGVSNVLDSSVDINKTLNLPFNSTENIFEADQDLLSQELCIYIFAGLTLATMVVVLYRSFMFFSMCMKSSVNLHNAMFTSVTRATMRFFNTNPSGQILNRFSKDMGQIDEQLPLVVIDCLEIFFALLGVLILVAVVNPWILIPTGIILIFFYLMRIVYVATSRSVKRLEGITRSPVFSHLNASLQGLTTIRAFKAQNILQKEFDAHQDVHSSAYYLFVASSRAFGLWLDIICLFYIACVTFSFLLLGEETFGGKVGLAITQSIGLTGMFQWGMRQSAELENQMTSVERVLEYTGLESEPALESAPDKKPKKDWPSQGKIVFKNLSLWYNKNELPVLKNLNFTIRPCEKVGIIGRTGAGKSSLLSALFRLTDTEGSIIIDGIDTKTIGLHDLRSKISIIPQEPVLFSGALRHNLDPFNEYPDAVLWNALEEVELKEVVEDLAAGLNHKVSEGGQNFSVGQRQLICLARAIVRNNKILVMDEATANVDPQTDAFIQETIRRKFSDCTVLTIAHRLLTVMDNDRILVMDAGNVVEFDHPYTLLRNESGFLYNMVQETGKPMADSLYKISEEAYIRKKV